jgi:hypothetical protein
MVVVVLDDVEVLGVDPPGFEYLGTVEVVVVVDTTPYGPGGAVTAVSGAWPRNWEITCWA